MTKLEIEAKFKVRDLDSLKNKLLDLGLESSGEVFYENVIFDYPDLRFREKRITFRLRKKGDKCVITHKEPSGKESKLKIKKETEVEVDDFERTKHIINRLGYIDSFVYDKKREKFEGEGFEVVIDKNPFIGIYIEIEADTEEIFFDVMNKLGFKDDEIIKENYRQVFEKYCKEKRLDVKNMTFEEEKALKTNLKQD